MDIFCRLRALLLTATVLISPLALAVEPIDLDPFAPADPHQQKYHHPTRGYLAPPTDTQETQPTSKEPLDLTPYTPSDPDIRMDTVDQNWNIFAGLGYMAALDATNGVRFQATADPYHEEDLLSDPKQSTHLQYLLGLQRVILVDHSLVQRFDIGPTIFYDPVTFSGQVYQYTSPALNNYDYRYSVDPINVDIEGQILFKRHGNPHKVGVAPYLLAGLGVSYVNLHYDETALGSTPSNTAYSFSDHAFRPVVVAGIGLQFDVLFKFFIRTDYRYLYRGDAKLKNSVFYDPITVNLDTQSINFLFGYRFS